MMGYFIGRAGYYEGDQVSTADLEVERRPESGMEWNGSWGWSKPALIAIAADKRYRVETGGKTIMGATFRTDRESQGLISGAAALTKITGQSIKWKTPAGFIEATAGQIEQVAIAVGNHVQACFAAEAEIIGLIEAGTVTTRDQIEDWSGWPE